MAITVVASEWPFNWGGGQRVRNVRILTKIPGGGTYFSLFPLSRPMQLAFHRRSAFTSWELLKIAELQVKSVHIPVGVFGERV